MFRCGDGATEFRLYFRPALARQNRRKNPAHAQRVVVERLEKRLGGIGPDAQGVEKIVGGRFDEFLVAQEFHRPRADNALMAHPSGRFAALAEHLHHVRPGAGDELGVLRGEVGFREDQIHERLVYRFIFGPDDFLRFGFVACQEALLLSCGAVFAVENCAASEHRVSVLHLCRSLYGHDLKPVNEQWPRSGEWCGSSEKFRAAFDFTDTFTDT